MSLRQGRGHIPGGPISLECLKDWLEMGRVLGFGVWWWDGAAAPIRIRTAAQGQPTAISRTLARKISAAWRVYRETGRVPAENYGERATGNPN